VVATVSAAWLAYIAIQRMQTQSKESSDALLSQRRVDYTLTVLRELAQCIGEGKVGSTARADLLLHMCPERLPMTRVALELFPTSEEREIFLRRAIVERGNLPWHTYDQCVALDEIAETARRIVGKAPDHEECTFQHLVDRALAEQEDDVSKYHWSITEEEMPELQSENPRRTDGPEVSERGLEFPESHACSPMNPGPVVICPRYPTIF
jgi:hypothetical protein